MQPPPDRAMLITGFPGFIARRLLGRLRTSHPTAEFFLLVQAPFVFEAERVCRTLEREHPEFADRWRVVVGDIRRPNLGVDEAHIQRLRARVTDVWHLAAVYDLAVPQSVAYAVNVTGTEHVLALCQQLARLRRLNYVSTCYVAGDRQGRIYEDELDQGQEFKNGYESTKYWAELKVQGAWEQIPTTIYRPSIVAGDSVTGETAKADGPYFMVQLLQALPRWLPVVHLGASAATFNVVPVDFVVEAMALLSEDTAATGTVVALADPTPLTARQFMDLTIAALGRTGAVGTLPLGIATRMLRLRPVERALTIPRQSLTYLNHPAQFDVSNAARLLEGRLLCPRVAEYWPTLVGYACRHPEIFKEATA